MSSPIVTLSVVGPTASGKSSLGIHLARALNGEILNVDSVQVYRDLNIGAAKVPESERGGVPHHLLDMRAPNESLNVGTYRELAIDCLREVSSRGKLPVLVGGSTMYLTVLLHGIADVPETPPEVRAAVASMSREAQHAELSTVDPVTAARLHVNDTQRVSRALEIYRITGRAPSSIFETHQFSSQEVVSLLVVLCRERDDLYARINERAAQMVREGLLAETQQVLERYGDVPALETLGYKQAKDVLQGRLDISQMEGEIAMHTRRFAKRQMTYLRNEPRKRGWITRPAPDEEAVEVVGLSQSTQRARESARGFRALSLTTEELTARVSERLARPLQRSEVWYLFLRGV